MRESVRAGRGRRSCTFPRTGPSTGTGTVSCTLSPRGTWRLSNFLHMITIPRYVVENSFQALVTNFVQTQTIVERVLSVIHYPFREVLDILNHEHPPSGTLAHLLSSSCSPLYTALIILATPGKSCSSFPNVVYSCLPSCSFISREDPCRIPQHTYPDHPAPSIHPLKP